MGEFDGEIVAVGLGLIVHRAPRPDYDAVIARATATNEVKANGAVAQERSRAIGILPSKNNPTTAYWQRRIKA